MTRLCSSSYAAVRRRQMTEVRGLLNSEGGMRKKDKRQRAEDRKQMKEDRNR